jgi:hypothetical protein
MTCTPADHRRTSLSNQCLLQVLAPGTHGWYPTFTTIYLAKGPRVLNRKGKEGSILALYKPGQEQIVPFFSNPNIRV